MKKKHYVYEIKSPIQATFFRICDVKKMKPTIKIPEKLYY